jgi:Tat protein secretion system quality control protein TatD with DNase activity
MNTILQDAQKQNVKGILIPSTQKKTIADAQVLAHSYTGVFFSVGFHPSKKRPLPMHKFWHTPTQVFFSL